MKGLFSSMPTYEYACKACGEHLEVVQSFKDNALTECPACGGQLRKVFGNIGVTFKGSGFYKTDSRSDSHKTATKTAEAKPADSAGAGKQSDTSSGSKGDAPAKSETKSGDGKSGGGGDGAKAGSSTGVAAAS
jgi:putative FmdB family regulatory protein